MVRVCPPALVLQLPRDKARVQLRLAAMPLAQQRNETRQVAAAS
jgi:hypothetical protein